MHGHPAEQGRAGAPVEQRKRPVEGVGGLNTAVIGLGFVGLTAALGFADRQASKYGPAFVNRVSDKEALNSEAKVLLEQEHSESGVS